MTAPVTRPHLPFSVTVPSGKSALSKASRHHSFVRTCGSPSASVLWTGSAEARQLPPRTACCAGSEKTRISGGDVSVAFGLISHERNECVADDADFRQDEFGLRSLLPSRNGALFESVDPRSPAQFLYPGGDLCGQGAVFWLDLVLVCLHQLRCRSAECEDEMRSYSLLD